MIQEQTLVEISTRYIDALLHSASGHQWSRKARQAGGQNIQQQVDELIWGQVAQTIFWNLKGTITITTVIRLHTTKFLE